VVDDPRGPYADVLDDEFLERLRRFVRARSPQGHDAEDVVQEALLKLLQRPLLPRDAARAWVFTTAQRAATDRWRRRSRATALDADTAPAPADAATNETVAYLAACLEPMLRDLPEADRELLRRIDVAGEAQVDAACELGVTGSTLRSRVQRARARLRAAIDACCAVDVDRRGGLVGHRRRAATACPCPPQRDG
jgi:RNA polymerase sigma-70 factor (ECF subfamily)